ncbi:hypothetical protein GJ496_008567 [Pomphorhynchus laevis]|nr:hypothetical protein GJ496_008567 [Pomphorhynchus laevis]
MIHLAKTQQDIARCWANIVVQITMSPSTYKSRKCKNKRKTFRRKRHINPTSNGTNVSMSTTPSMKSQIERMKNIRDRLKNCSRWLETFFGHKYVSDVEYYLRGTDSDASDTSSLFASTNNSLASLDSLLFCDLEGYDNSYSSITTLSLNSSDCGESVSSNHDESVYSHVSSSANDTL